MNDFSLKINTANILKAVGLLITICGLIWGLLSKFNTAEVERMVIQAKLDMLLEERLAKMEQTELYKRMNEVLKMTPADEDNYSLDRYMNPKEETKQASKE